MSTTTKDCRSLALFSHPRTASNLLLKILNIDEQPNVLSQSVSQRPSHVFTPAIKLQFDDRGQARRVCDWSEDEQNILKRRYSEGLVELREYFNCAETAGKMAFFREHTISIADPVAQHCFFSGTKLEQEAPWSIYRAGQLENERTLLNNTLLPDELLKQCFPVFIIRHPALVFPSYCRVIGGPGSSKTKVLQQAAIVNTYHWTRSLYDCYSKAFGIRGIVLDADDIMTDPNLIISFSKNIGLDPSKLKFTWTATSSAEEIAATQACDAQHKEFMATLETSTGVRKDKTSSQINIDKEKTTWIEEFGEELGTQLSVWVTEAMKDYTYLHSNKFSMRTLV